ncbi:aBC transporter related [Clostridium sp. CAG:277]|nr:aBC transporter related [Clostridium sp. CAG:277]
MRLVVENVSKSFGDKKVLESVSLTLEEGEIVCILGASGVGKSTLFHIISGLLMPDEGRVLLDGEDVTGKPGKISYMLQKDMMLPYKTVLDNVALPLIIKKTSGEGKIGPWRRIRTAREKAAAYFEEFGLSGYEKKYPAQLSGGMRQRAALLRTYLFSQEVALLDEPFSALDTITKGKMHQWYLSIMEEIHMSTLFITHDMDEAIILSDRIYILGGTPAVIQDEITVSGKKPGAEEFKISPEFLEYKKRILEYIQ